MSIPLNAIAETIQRLETENNILAIQAYNIQLQIAANESAILSMKDFAQWGDDVEYPVSDSPPQMIEPADPPTV